MINFMKKLNSKGFVLAESIVVSVFVLGIFTYLAVNVIPLVTEYDRAINYDNPQEVYAANLLFEELSAYINLYDFFYADSYNTKFIDLNNMQEEYFKTLQKMLKIKKVQKNEGCINLGRSMTEYCKYLQRREALVTDDMGYSDTIDGVSMFFSLNTILVEFENGNFASFDALVNS